MGNDFFLVEEGSAYADVNGVGKVKEYVKGDYFGELALLKSQPRAANVIASASPTKLMVFDGGTTKCNNIIAPRIPRGSSEYPLSVPGGFPERLPRIHRGSPEDPPRIPQ